ncbi:MAG: hypothetical protein N2C14_24815 [Planctomycetales bacterium]
MTQGEPSDHLIPFLLEQGFSEEEIQAARDLIQETGSARNASDVLQSLENSIAWLNPRSEAA